jgi:ubiquitin C-terminal hydrolase
VPSTGAAAEESEPETQQSATAADAAAAAAELLRHANGSLDGISDQAASVSSTSRANSCEACGASLQYNEQQQQQQQQQVLAQQEEEPDQQEDSRPNPPQQQQQPRQQGGNPLLRKSLLPPAPPSSAGSSSVDAVFGGVLVSTICCSGCGHVSVSYEPFLDLSLPIPLAEAGSGSLTRKVCAPQQTGIQRYPCLRGCVFV